MPSGSASTVQLKRWHPAATMTAPTHHILARATNAISWKEAAWGFSLST